MFSWFKKTPTFESPVGDPDKLDIISKLANGRVDLLLVIVGPIQPTAQVLDVIGRKFRNYCQYVNSPDFQAEFGAPTIDRVTIGLKPQFEVPDEVLDLCDRIHREERTPATLAVFYQYPTPEEDTRPAPL